MFTTEPFSGLPLDQGFGVFSGFPFPFAQPHGRPRRRGHPFASCGARPGIGSRGHGACRPRSQPHRSGSNRTRPTAETRPETDFAQVLQSIAEAFIPDVGATTGANLSSASDADTSDSGAFRPPLDLFATPSAYIVHLAVPGAQKEDITVEWDTDNSALRIAGVLHRPGDEALLSTLVPDTTERRVGYFERVVPLPPSSSTGVEVSKEPQTQQQQPQKQPEQSEQTEHPELPEQTEQPEGQQSPRSLNAYVEDAEDSDDELYIPDTVTLTDGDATEVDLHLADVEHGGKDEIDPDGITARMQDGLLIATVPRVEKGWTDVRKVDIE